METFSQRLPFYVKAIISTIVFVSLIGCASNTATQSSLNSFGKPAAAENAANAGPVAIAEFARQWNGVYHAYPRVMGIEIDLQVIDTHSMSGTVAFYPLSDKTRSGRHSGSYKATGSFNPLSHTFELVPVGWIKRASIYGVLPTLRGVFNPSREAASGFFINTVSKQVIPGAYFTLAHPEQVARLNSAMKKATKGGNGFLAMFAGAPSDDVIRQWAGKLTEEYPNIDPYRTEMGRLYRMAANLFEDDHFSRYFGQPFDVLGNAAQKKINRKLATTKNQSLRQYSGLSRAFGFSGSPGSPNVMQALLGQREIRFWYRKMMSRLQALPYEMISFDQIDAVESAAVEVLQSLWPSEIEQFQALPNQARQTIALPTLDAAAKGMISNTHDYLSSKALYAWHENARRHFKWIPHSDRQKISGSVTAKIETITGPMIQQEAVALNSFAGGLQGLQQGSDWYRIFQEKYSFAGATLSYQDALSKLNSLRARQFATEETAIISFINGMGVIAEIDQLKKELLQVPGDNQISSGRRIEAAANRQMATIRQTKKGAWYTLLAYISHGVYRNAEAGNSPWVAGMAAWARSYLVHNALRNFFPKTTEENIKNFRVFLLQYIDGKLHNITSNALELKREDLITEAKLKYPNDIVLIEASSLFYDVLKSAFKIP